MWLSEISCFLTRGPTQRLVEIAIYQTAAEDFTMGRLTFPSLPYLEPHLLGSEQSHELSVLVWPVCSSRGGTLRKSKNIMDKLYRGKQANNCPRG